MTTFLKSASLAAALLLSLIGKGQAGDIKRGQLTITAPWTKATPAGARVAGGYLSVRNTGTVPDRLIGGTFDAAKRVEIHEMSIVNDIMRMRELPDGLTIKPGEKVVLKPGSYHLMLMGLKRQLKPGDNIKGTLVFAKAGRVAVTFAVRTLAGKPAHHGMTHHGAAKHGKTSQ